LINVLNVEENVADRERLIAATVMSISIPCMAQTAMIFGLSGKYEFKGLLRFLAQCIFPV